MVSSRPRAVNKETLWDCSVTSEGIVVFELIELNVILGLGIREGGNLRDGERDVQKGERALGNTERKGEGEEKEVKLMFGQMEKDGWELMEWVEGTEEAEQLGLIRRSSHLRPALHSSLLFSSIFHPALY